MEKDFDFHEPKAILQIGKGTSKEEIDAQMEQLEKSIGINDYHVEVHINGVKRNSFDTFFLTAKNEDGEFLFTARASKPLPEVLELLAKAIGNHIGVLARILSISRQEISQKIGEDKLMEVIEKHARGQG